jgi:hypothetical protein
LFDYWIETLALEAETAISNLEISEQQYYRHAVAKTITKITQDTRNKNNTKRTKKNETNDRHKTQAVNQ